MTFSRLGIVKLLEASWMQVRDLGVGVRALLEKRSTLCPAEYWRRQASLSQLSGGPSTETSFFHLREEAPGCSGAQQDPKTWLQDTAFPCLCPPHRIAMVHLELPAQEQPEEQKRTQEEKLGCVLNED
ncbi:hypothetical protein LEMLEM_LOCUS12231 [Lemmus lemmus]